MRRSTTAVAMLSLLFIASECNPPPPPAVTATAIFTNSPDIPRTATLSLSHTIGSSTPRIATLPPDSAFTYLSEVSLSVAPAGVTEDAFVLQNLSRPSITLSGDEEPDTAVRVNMGFVEQFTGNVLHLSKDAPAVDSPTTLAVPLTERQSGVNPILARWAADDAVLPFATAPCPANLTVPVTPPACFDLSFLISTIGSVITSRVSAAINPPPGGGTDPDPRVRGGGVRFAGYIPNVIGALDAPTRRMRGFGLIYAVDVEVRAIALGGPLDSGTVYNPATVWIPLAILFDARAPEPGIRASIDPVDLGPSGTMASRIGVEVFPSTPLEEGAVIAETLRTGFVGAITTIPPGTPPALDILEGFFNRIRPARPLGANFDVLMMPVGPSPNRPMPVAGLRYQVLFMD